jgi:hypothetical protein
VSFAAIILCVASQRMFIVVVAVYVDSVRKLLDTPSYRAVENFKYPNNILPLCQCLPHGSHMMF